MDDKHKTKAQLIGELGELRQRVAQTDKAQEPQPNHRPPFLAWADSAASTIFIFQDSAFRYTNPAMSRLTGYTAEELLATNIWSLIHPEFRELIRERVAAWRRGERVPARSEFKILLKSGETRWINADSTFVEFDGSLAELTIAFDSTEHKLAEEALNASEERYRNIVETAQEGIWMVDEKAVTAYVNHHLAEMFGYTRDEMLGRSVFDFVDDAARQETRRLLERGRQGIKWRHDFRFLKKDGSDLWTIVSTTPLFDGGGRFAGGLAMLVDVTERHCAEAALRESEERYRDMVENARDIIYSHDLKGNYTSVNKAGEQITGYTREEALQLNFQQTVAPEYLETARQMIAATLAGQKETVYDLEIIAKDGQRITVEVNTRVVLQDDLPIGIQGIARDVTERKRAEEALRESQSHLQAILDNCPAMIFEKDLEGRYRQTNRQFERTFNLTPEKVLGRTDAEVFPPELAAAFRATDCAVLEAGRSLEFEEAAVYADGPHAYIVHKFPLQDGVGSVYAVGGISTDITARKRAEDDLRKQKGILQKIFDHIPVMIRFLDEDGRVKLVNREWERTLGWSLEEIEGRGLDIFAELYPDPEYRQYVLNFIAASTGEFTDLKTTVRDGRVIDTTFANVRLEDGTNIGIGRDISDRKRVEEALRISERKYKDLVTFSPVGIYQSLPDGTIVTANAALAQILGYDSLDDLLKINMERDVYLDPAERRRLIQEYEDRGFAGEIGVQWKRKNGTPFWVQLNVHTVKDAQARTQYFEGFVLDITERKRADELLRRQTAQLAALHEIGLEISAERELSRVLDVATRRAAELLNASHCSTYIRDPEQAQLNLVASLDRELIGLRLKDGEGLAGRVALLGHAQAVDDYTNWEGRALMFDAKRFGPSLGAPLRWQQTVIGAISVARRPGEEPFSSEDSHFLEQIAAKIAIAIHQATLFEDVQEGHNRLRVLSHRLIDAQEAERKHLARELHDQIGQALTAVRISLQALQSSCVSTLASPLDDCLTIIDDALQQVHDLSLDLRPSLLDDLGLVAALRWYVDRVASRAGLVRCFEADVLETRLAPQVETACFRIAQEALTNVLRHANAATVWVQVTRRDSGLQLVVQDDGVGFDVRAAMSRTGVNASLGLQGMQERAAALGGIVDIKSQHGNGVEVVVSFPLAQAYSL